MEQQELSPDNSKDAILRATGLSKTYGSGDGKVTAVDDLSLEIERGTVVGVLGPNGAGKTTTIKILLGLIEPDTGEVRIDGVDPIAAPSEGYRSVSAMLEGARNIYWRLTVRENLRFFARLADKPADNDRIDALIEQVGLTAKADTTVNELSRGMKQKASLACTLIRDTPLSFLDEPTLGLDVESSLELRRQLRDLVERESRTVVLSSHDMDVIEAVCDRVIIMNEGRVVADDALEDLIDVFRTQAYRITLEGRLEDTRKRRLEDEFAATEWIERGPKLLFDVPHVQDSDFYDLMDVLRGSDCRLLAVETTEIDLEDVFLEVTDAGDTHSMRVEGKAHSTSAINDPSVTNTGNDRSVTSAASDRSTTDRTEGSDTDADIPPNTSEADR